MIKSKYIIPCIIIGGVLGSFSTQFGFGNLLLLILNTLIGSITCIVACPYKISSTFAFCCSLMISFWVVGFDVISDPLSVFIFLILGVFILLPTFVAYCVTLVLANQKN